jgi:F-type H+-transporting ATPase subunit gamma
MKRLSELADEEISMSTLVELTGIFEGLASMRIAQIKDQVLQSTKFYNELWAIYSQIRVGDQFSFGREKSDNTAVDKELMIIITAEGSFSGDIDQKLVKLALKDYSKDKNEVIVIGHHGAMQLAQHQVTYKKYYKMPTRDKDINVSPVVDEIKKYKACKIYYQQYVSLMVQDVKRTELSNAIFERANDQDTKDTINDKTYIFEPSTFAVVAHLERSMMQITVSQLILESKLAQYASRFQAMTTANSRAEEIRDNLHIDYNRAKRAVKDERLKEIVNGLKKINSGAVA